MRELTALLESVPVRVVTARELGIAFEIEESGSSYAENARLKAEAGVRLTRLPSLGEDAGLEVPALDGQPGLRSARFAGPRASGPENVARLLAALGDRSGNRPRAYFRCAAVVVFPDGRSFSGEGVLEGQIAPEPRGSEGFGYDPVFVLPDGRHLAELSLTEKNLLSHRARALAGLEVRGAFDALIRLEAT